MRTFKLVYRGSVWKRALVVFSAASISLFVVSSALASAVPIDVCVPEAENKAVTSSTATGCKAKSTKVSLPKEAVEQEKLLAILPYITFQATGVGGKPTIRFSGVNVQIVNGMGTSETINGAGNLIVGYDELHGFPYEQTGSHNVVVGAERQTFTSYGAIVGGRSNRAGGPYSVVFGEENTTLLNGAAGAVTGGQANTVTHAAASVSGGHFNDARGEFAAVSGGEGNTADGFASSVAGGSSNKATVEDAAVTGGEANLANAYSSSVTGGRLNVASGEYSAILGGKEQHAETAFSHFP